MTLSTRSLNRLGACLVVLFLAATGTASAGWYTSSLPDSLVVPIRGETADTAALGDDRYVDDNLDFLLSQHEWLIVNFSAYWCPDSDNFAPGYWEAAHSGAYPGLRWAYAEVDGTRGNENFRERFNLPGVPTVILFHNGAIAESPDGTPAILDGHEGDKTSDDLRTFLATFYQGAYRRHRASGVGGTHRIRHRGLVRSGDPVSGITGTHSTESVRA